MNWENGRLGGHFAIMRMDSHVGTMEGFVHGNR